MSFKRIVLEYAPPKTPGEPPLDQRPEDPGDCQALRSNFKVADVFDLRGARLVDQWETEIQNAFGNRTQREARDQRRVQWQAPEWPTELALRHDLAHSRSAPQADDRGVWSRVHVAMNSPYRFDKFYHFDSTPEWTERIRGYEDRKRQGERPLPPGSVRLIPTDTRAYGQEMQANPS